MIESKILELLKNTITLLKDEAMTKENNSIISTVNYCKFFVTGYIAAPVRKEMEQSFKVKGQVAIKVLCQITMIAKEKKVSQAAF